jgi:hypothetical protein
MSLLKSQDKDDYFITALNTPLVTRKWDPSHSKVSDGSERKLSGDSDDFLHSERSAKKQDNRLCAIIAIQLNALAMVFIGATFKVASGTYGVTVGDFQVARALLMFLVMTPVMLYYKRQPIKHLRVKGTGE